MINDDSFSPQDKSLPREVFTIHELAFLLADKLPPYTREEIITALRASMSKAMISTLLPNKSPTREANDKTNEIERITGRDTPFVSATRYPSRPIHYKPSGEPHTLCGVGRNYSGTSHVNDINQVTCPKCRQQYEGDDGYYEDEDD